MKKGYLIALGVLFAARLLASCRSSLSTTLSDAGATTEQNGGLLPPPEGQDGDGTQPVEEQGGKTPGEGNDGDEQGVPPGLTPVTFLLVDVVDGDATLGGYSQHLVLPDVDLSSEVLPATYQIHAVDDHGDSLGKVAGPFPGSAPVLDFTLYWPLPERYRVFGKFGETLQPVSAVRIVRNEAELANLPPSGELPLGLVDAKVASSINDLHFIIKQGSTFLLGVVDADTNVNSSSIRFHPDGTGEITTVVIDRALNGDWNTAVTPNEITSTVIHDFLVTNNWTYGSTAAYTSSLPAGAEEVEGNTAPLKFTQHSSAGQWSYLVVGGSANDEITMNTATSVVAGLGGNDRFLLGGWKITSFGGSGDDYFRADLSWESRPSGEAGNDSMFITAAAGAMTNSQLSGGSGNDCVVLASSPMGVTFASNPYVLNQGNLINLDEDDDLLIIDDVNLRLVTQLNAALGSGSDTLLFAPESVRISSGASALTLDGGAGFDTFVFHGQVPRLDVSDTPIGFMQDVVGSVNYDVKNFETISMKAVDGSRCSTPPQRTWNNAGVITLKLSANQIQRFAAGNELGDKLFVDGDLDGKDRVDLSGYTANPACDLGGHLCWCASGATCLLVQPGLLVSTDGTNFAPL